MGKIQNKYLEDKTRAKAISDEIKAKYGAERGNRGIRISDINDPATRFSTRLLGCKLMQVSQRGSIGWCGHRRHAVCKGELDELGPIPLEFILGGLQGHTGLGL
jgi:hypothetical protein